MIIEEIFYGCACDNCKTLFEGYEHSFWNDRSVAKENAIDSGWLESDDGKNIYCEDCAHHNDKDELIIDESRKKN